MPSAQTSETFNCNPEEFFKIIADYEHYPDFLSEVKAVRVLKDEGERKLAEFKVNVMKTFTYQLWMTESSPQKLSWNFAGGDLFKTSSGSWELRPEGDKTKATYAVEATFSLFVPGPIAKTLLAVNLPGMMAAYHKRVKEIYGR